MPARRLDYMALAELVPAAVNPKRHDIEGVRKSVQRFGVIEVGVLDERTGAIISGHGRTEVYELLAAAETEGQEPPDGIEVRDGKWYVPMIRGWASADDDEAVAAGIALNRLTEAGGWDPHGLVEQLAMLKEQAPMGLEGTGFDTDTLADMLLTIGPAPDLDALADEYGPAQDDDFWPSLHFKVSPDTKARFDKLVVGVAEEDRFAWLLDRAEGAEPAAQPEPASTEPDPELVDSVVGKG